MVSFFLCCCLCWTRGAFEWYRWLATPLMSCFWHNQIIGMKPDGYYWQAILGLNQPPLNSFAWLFSFLRLRANCIIDLFGKVFASWIRLIVCNPKGFHIRKDTDTCSVSSSHSCIHDDLTLPLCSVLQVMQVVKEQIMRALTLKPNSLDQFKSRLQNLSYTEILKIRQSERMNQEDFQSRPILWVMSCCHSEKSKHWNCKLLSKVYNVYLKCPSEACLEDKTTAKSCT